MGKTKRQLLKTILTAVLVVGIVIALLFLITWKPKENTESYQTATVSTRDIERTVQVTGLVIPQVIDENEEKTVQLYVDEDDISDIAVDDEATMTIEALGDDEYTGKIYSVSSDPRITGDVTEYEVIVRFNEVPDSVLKGMHVDTTFTVGAVSEVLSVPNDSLYKKGEDYYIDKIQEERRAYFPAVGIDRTIQKLVPTKVSIDFEGDEYTEVTDGLREGERIVVK